MDKDGVNLATDTSKAFCTSWWKDTDPRFLAKNAVDGSESTAWVYPSPRIENWFAYDFVTPVNIVSIAIRPGSTAGFPEGYEIQSAEVEVSNDGVSWSQYGKINPKIPSSDRSLHSVLIEII